MAHDRVAERFVGVWELVRVSDRPSSGPPLGPPAELGPDPLGRLVYTASGHVSVNFMRQGRPEWREVNAAAPDEALAAATGYGAYAGRYTVRASEDVVIHHVDVALIPNRIGRDLTRRFSFQGDDRLTLTTPPFRRADGVEVERELTWGRIG